MKCKANIRFPRFCLLLVCFFVLSRCSDAPKEPSNSENEEEARVRDADHDEPEELTQVEDVPLSISVAPTPPIQNASDSQSTYQENFSNTVFSHPGLRLPIFGAKEKDNGAYYSAHVLVEAGLGARVVEAPGLDPAPIEQEMLRSRGSQFIGIHHSEEGKPEYINDALNATRRAGRSLKRVLKYHAIVGDPVDLERYPKRLDLLAPELGNVFIFVSSPGALFRANIKGLPEHFLQEPKVFVLSMEDYIGAQRTVDHFEIVPKPTSYFLERSKSEPLLNQKLRDMLISIADLCYRDAPREEILSTLATFKENRKHF